MTVTSFLSPSRSQVPECWPRSVSWSWRGACDGTNRAIILDEAIPATPSTHRPGVGPRPGVARPRAEWLSLPRSLALWEVSARS